MKNRISTFGVLAIVFFSVLFLTGAAIGTYYVISNNAVTPNPNNPQSLSCQGSNPTLSLISTDALKPGTSVGLSGANSTIYDGSYVGGLPSSVTAGKSINVLGTATGYLNANQNLNSIACGANIIRFTQYAFDAPAVTAYNSNFQTLSTASQNQTNSANVITDTIKLSGTPYKSTGDMLIVIDFANKTQVTTSDINLNGATRVTNPNWVSPSGTNAAVVSFVVPAIVNGGIKTYDLTLTPESGITIGGSAVVVSYKVYSLNPVILDSTLGTFQTSNTWQDSLGANQTIATTAGTSYNIV